MTTAQLNNLLIYVGVAVANMLTIAVSAVLAGGTLPGFREGEPFAPARGQLVALLAIIAPVLTTWLASNRPRFGSEDIAGQVNGLRAQGVHRSEMVVLPQADAAVTLSQRQAKRAVLSAIQVQQVTDELERRLRATPARQPDPRLSNPLAGSG